MDLSTFDYHLPDELIARTPLARRDASKLFVYDSASDTIVHDTFENLQLHLPKDAFLVVNETAVLPARIEAHKAAGGVVELLLLINEWDKKGAELSALSDRKLTIGMELFLDDTHRVRVVGQDEKIFKLELLFPALELEAILRARGVTPVPKYLGESGLTEAELRERYQAVFARETGSVAAPTASLHFTPELLARLERSGVARYPVTLHVGLGTFSPFTEEQYAARTLFSERFFISPESLAAINAAKERGKRCVAVGTTATRTLESAAHGGRLIRESGATTLFIVAPYHFQIVDALITNFHLPKSSLMLLVDAFLRNKGARRTVRDLYEIAMKEKYRFFSFGDSMLLL